MGEGVGRTPFFTRPLTDPSVFSLGPNLTPVCFHSFSPSMLQLALSIKTE